MGAQLINRGLITEEQLTVALDEQRMSGGQIGAILVKRGFVTPELVALALATQHGGVLKTEYGFAMGFGQTLESPAVIDEPPVSVHLSKVDAAVAIAAAAPPADLETDRAAVREELELASGESMRLGEANERLGALRVELEQSLAQESQRVAALERELAALRAAGAAGGEAATRWQEAHANAEQSLAQWQAAYSELEQRFTQAGEQVAALEADVASRDVSLEELRASASTCESVRNELELALAAEVRRGQAVKEEFAAAERRFVAAEAAQSIRGELEEQLEQVAARAAALEDQVRAGEELRASAAASEQGRIDLELRLERAAEQLRQADTVRGELEARLAAAVARAAGLESEAAAADELRRSALASEQTAGELERHLETVRVELELRTAELEAARATAQAGPGPMRRRISSSSRVPTATSLSSGPARRRGSGRRSICPVFKPRSSYGSRDRRSPGTRSHARTSALLSVLCGYAICVGL